MCASKRHRNSDTRPENREKTVSGGMRENKTSERTKRFFTTSILQHEARRENSQPTFTVLSKLKKFQQYMSWTS